MRSEDRPTALEPAAPTPRCRDASVLDGIILVAALALWFASARSDFVGLSHWSLYDRTSKMIIGLRLASLLALFLTVANLPIRLQGPRASFRQIARQPGMIACLAV